MNYLLLFEQQAKKKAQTEEQSSKLGSETDKIFDCTMSSIHPFKT